MRLADHLSPSRIHAIQGRTKDDVLRELVAVAAAEPQVRDQDGLLQAIFGSGLSAAGSSTATSLPAVYP